MTYKPFSSASPEEKAKQLRDHFAAVLRLAEDLMEEGYTVTRHGYPVLRRLDVPFLIEKKITL